MPGLKWRECLTWNEPVLLLPMRRDLEHFAVYGVHRRERVVGAYDEGNVDFARALAD